MKNAIQKRACKYFVVYKDTSYQVKKNIIDVKSVKKANCLYELTSF